jgi:hypothetical protein
VRSALAALPAVVALAVAQGGCRGEPPPVATIPYRQDFSAPVLGPEWQTRGPRWAVVGGRLYSEGTGNVPLWLSAALPHDVRVSFDAVSESEAVDFKVELFGDGSHHASGYVVVFAGWHNTRSEIARLDEHGPERQSEDDAALRAEVARDELAAAARHRDRRETAPRAVHLEPGHRYHVVLERRGHELAAWLDGEPHLSYFDPSPLGGPGHDRFAFNDWASRVFFDELVIEPLAAAP